MQNKGAITLLTIALALVSLYQLSFTWKTNRVEKVAREYAQGDPVKEKVYLDCKQGSLQFPGNCTIHLQRV